MPDRVVHIVDDDDAMRDSLAFLLEASGYNVRTYVSALPFLERGEVERGCLLTDVRMPEMSGLELIKALSERGSRLPVVVITGHGDVPLAVEAMRAGAVDFIEKPFGDEVILSAVRQALEREKVDRRQAEERGAIAERIANLSMREHQVLEGLIAGKPNKAIARELGISHRTVEIYRGHVMAKMGAASLPELVRMTITAENGG
jgi:two-component system response regulator FixJ